MKLWRTTRKDEQELNQLDLLFWHIRDKLKLNLSNSLSASSIHPRRFVSVLECKALRRKTKAK